MKAKTIANFNEFVGKDVFSDKKYVKALEHWNSEDVQKKLTEYMKKHTAKPRVKKDPKAPKHPKSKYMWFCEEMREQAKTDLGEGAPSKSVIAKLGEMWREFQTKCEADDKDSLKTMKKYEKKAKEDRTRYDQQMEVYVPDETVAAESGKKKKDPLAPKKALSSFMYFSQENRAKTKEKLGATAKVPEVSKDLGLQWKKLKLAEKKKYEEMAEKDKERYNLEKEKYDEKKLENVEEKIEAEEAVIENLEEEVEKLKSEKKKKKTKK